MKTASRFMAIALIAASLCSCTRANEASKAQDDDKSVKGAKQEICLADGVTIELAMTPTLFGTNLLARHEVTQALWHEIMGGTAPSKDDAYLPKTRISFLDVKEFLRKLNDRPEVISSGFGFRLPTVLESSFLLMKAELEFRQSKEEVVDFGAPETLLARGWFAENGDGTCHPVGTKNANKQGLCDLLGNVWEMTSSEVPNDAGLIRCLGGSFRQKASRCTSSFEYWYGKHDAEDDVGFRLVVMDRTEYLEEKEMEDKDRALKQIETSVGIAELDMKYARGLGKIIYNRELDALQKLQMEIEGEKTTEDMGNGEQGFVSFAKKGDRLVVWKSENNGTEITFDGASFAFRSTSASDGHTDYRDVKTESVITIGDVQQTKVFFKKIGDSWNEMIRGASYGMETSFPEVESAEWTYESDSIDKVYGRKRYIELEARCEGTGRFGKAEQLTLSTKMFKAKEGDWSWMSEVYISEKDVFAIKEKHLVVDDLVSKYARMTGGGEVAGDANSPELQDIGENISTLLAKLNEDMVKIPNRPLHVCKFEVTQALWKAVMGSNPSYFKGDDLPIESISWDDCQEFIKKLNSFPEVKNANIVYRLPTDNEWEFACRAGREENDKNFDNYAWVRDRFNRNADSSTHSVGTKKPNAFGLYDMIGNVAEWTSDEAIGKYFRNCRGGCCDDTFVGYDMKRGRPYCYKGPDVGFRLVYDSIK